MSNSSAKVSKVSGLVKKIGPNVILKVMSGDKISARSDYYYKANNNTVSNNNLLNDIVTSLVGMMMSSNASDALKGNSGIIQSTLSNEATSPLNNLLTPERPSEPQASPPKGYLNVVFFDEQFNYVNSYFMRVNTACDDSRSPLMLIDKEAPKNGWAYIYLSNESDEPVYFDNFQVTHERGKIIEENHYYSYGLKIEGISSRAQETVLNRYGYQGDFSEHDEETALDEFDLRHFDPQTGRWTTTDPYEQFANPYLGMGNNPVSNVDPDGGDIFGILSSEAPWFLHQAFNAAEGFIVGSVIGAATSNGRNWLNGGLIGSGAALIGGNWNSIGRTLGDAGNWVRNQFSNNELLFNTVIEAAKYWGKTYNDNSIVERKEYGSTIYEVIKSKKTYYKYSIPNRAINRGGKVPISNAPLGSKVIADIHSHSDAWGLHPGEVKADNNFSVTDKWDNYDKKIDGYLTTPDGSLKKYDYRKAKEIIISTDLPSDPKYPYPEIRKNQIDPFVLPKNEPSISIEVN